MMSVAIIKPGFALRRAGDLVLSGAAGDAVKPEGLPAEPVFVAA
jgi:hypothetical protein